MQLEIPFGQRKFLSRIVRSDRKRIAIIVHPDLSIETRVPIDSDLNKIKNFVTKRAAWIAKQVDYFNRFHPLPVKRQYVSGETHLYLGKQYRLKVQNGRKQYIKLQGQFFIVEAQTEQNNDIVKELMQLWYIEHVRSIIKKRISKILPGFFKYGIETPTFKIQLMKRRWGSCSKKKNITLNTELVKVPISCIDYVITHELCHLLSSRHDPKFYRILSKFMPDWELRKTKLERFLI